MSLPTDPAAPQNWRPPAPVAPAAGRAWTELVRQVSDRLGMRVSGWVLLGAAIGCALLGWQLRWVELRLLALFAALLLGIALLFTIGHPRLTVRLGVSSNRVRVGDRLAGRLDVANAAPRRNLPARVDLPIGAELASFWIPSLASGQVRVERFTIPTGRRGVVTVGPAVSVQGDPFGLVGRQTMWTDSIDIFVHPRTVGLPGRQTGLVHDLEGHASVTLSASDLSFHALREYVPGDDRRHVHWRSSARAGTLLVKQYEQTLQSRVAVGIDLGVPGYLGEDDFEDAISVAASVALQAIREQNPLAVLSNAESLPVISGQQMLDQMSRLEQQPKQTVLDLAGNIRDQEPEASVIFLITGAGTSHQQLRRACALFEVDARVIGIQLDPSPGAGRPAVSVRTISNVSTVRIPALAELPRALRRATQ